MFCHIGLGEAYVRSYEFFLSSIVTSGGARKNYRDLVKVEGFLGHPYRILVERFRNDIVYSYKYNHRHYYVFPQQFHTLFMSLSKLMNSLYRLYKGNVDRIFERIENVVIKCRDVEACSRDLSAENDSVAEEIVKNILRGRKALTSRFERNSKRCTSDALRYFPELLNIHVYRYESLEDLRRFLLRLFPERAARAYYDFASSRSSILIARDELILVVREGDYDRYSSFRMYADDCVDREHYFLVKIVGVLTLNNYVNRVEWVALLGYDKNSNQVFLHYVPPTMVLHKAERCRLWILGLIDGFGRELVSSYRLVEV